MNSRLQNLLNIRGVKIALEVFVILLIYLGLKSWMQSNMVEGLAPDITGELIDGQNFKLQKQHGKPILIHFWASWCGICKLEQDSIEAISRDYSVISVAMNSGTKQDVQNYLSEHQLSFPVLNDPDGQIAQQYGVRAVPASFILDPSGKIRFRETGYTSEWGLRIRLWLAAD